WIPGIVSVVSLAALAGACFPAPATGIGRDAAMQSSTGGAGGVLGAGGGRDAAAAAGGAGGGSDAGSGGAGGSTEAGRDYGVPQCMAGVKNKAACTNEPECVLTCGPVDVGLKACLCSMAMWQCSPCLFDLNQSYACFKLPATLIACPPDPAD